VIRCEKSSRDAALLKGGEFANEFKTLDGKKSNPAGHAPPAGGA